MSNKNLAYFTILIGPLLGLLPVLHQTLIDTLQLCP